MESRIQDNEQRRREGNNNGTTLHSFSQTLDQHHLQRQASFGQQARSPTTQITPVSKSSIKYRECLKNHAASVGGNVYDGCGEFMPSGEEGTLEALKCAACDCHRNFHRKEVDGETQLRSRSIMLNPIQLPPPLPTSIKYSSMHTSPSSAIVAPMNVAFGGVSESSSEDLNNVFQSDGGVVQPPPPPPPYVLSKKRFRTKFTQEQKDRMLEFAEKIGWRFQKQDEEELERFCAEVGVRRQVFKVWMHNNKNVKNKQHEQEQEQEDDNNNNNNNNINTDNNNNPL